MQLLAARRRRCWRAAQAGETASSLEGGQVFEKWIKTGTWAEDGAQSLVAVALKPTDSTAPQAVLGALTFAPAPEHLHLTRGAHLRLRNRRLLRSYGQNLKLKP